MKKNPQGVFDYHEQTKHLPNRYAASPAGMDWATEPAPYRRYEGAEEISLPLLKVDSKGGFNELFVRGAKPEPFSFENISAFLELSMGLSAQKSFMDSTWALRMNPSSGNLHPTESYIITPDETPASGVFHYNPGRHALEKRADLTESIREGLTKNINKKGFLAVLTSIDWREAWKYGARAFRYSCIDTGHALACLSFSAALLGWRISPLNTLSDENIRDMLGFNKTEWRRYEEERVEGAFFVHSAKEPGSAVKISEKTIRDFSKLEFKGAPNRLSPHHVHWPLIEKVAELTEKGAVETEPAPLLPPHKYLYGDKPDVAGAAIIRKRRSAQAYDGERWASNKEFFEIIDRLIPTPSCAPFDSLHGEPQINLLLFIHRIEGLARGLYMLIRNKNDMDDLKKTMRKEFLWEQSEYENLYLLMEGDLTDEARYISCQQDIAGDGAFSAAMIARFRENIEVSAFSYRNLFMEAGMAGQVLYLAAEAQGLRGTGIGCFYDDMVHELLGFNEGDNTFQSLYHFTVGAPITDSRIQTVPPYQHLR